MAIIDFPMMYVPDDKKGRPLFNGQLFVGIPGLDPEDGNGNPINSKQLNVVQEDGTVIPVSQPFIIGPGGVPTWNGATVRLDVDGNYSFKVLDKLGAQTYYVENVFDGIPITDLEAVARALNVQDDDVIYSTDTTTPIPAYIYDSSQQKTYAVPADAQGKLISSVVVDVLNTTVGGPYVLGRSNKGSKSKVETSQHGAEGVADAALAITNAIDESNRVNIDTDVTLTTAVSITKPVRVTSDAPAVLITAPTTQATPAFDISVGGILRKKTRLEHMDFDAGVGECVRVATTNPFEMNDIRFNTGKDALKMTSLFYGSATGIEFQSSGMDLFNVNNFEFIGSDARGTDAPGRWPNATDYAFVLDDCDGVSFENMTFEQWDGVRVMRMVNSKNITFKKVWFESNDVDRTMAVESTQNVNFIGGCFIELFPSPAEAFITINNTAVVGAPRKLVTLINMKDSYLRLNNDPVTNFELVKVEFNGEALLNMDGMSLRNGHMILDKRVKAHISNMTLSTTTGAIDEVKSIETLPTALLQDGWNSWVANSAHSAEWDWAGGVGFVQVSGPATTIALTTTLGEYNTGTTAIKATLPSASSQRVFQLNMSDMGPITTDGQTHLIFMRIRTTGTVDIQFTVEGLFTEYQIYPLLQSKDGDWIDYVLKTSSDTTFAQGTQGNPKINVKLQNNSASAVDFLMDRIDYEIVQGDVILP